jgi:hypothetical protein
LKAHLSGSRKKFKKLASCPKLNEEKDTKNQALKEDVNQKPHAKDVINNVNILQIFK